MDTNILKTVSDPTRLKILVRIRRGEICACELPRSVKKTQPAVSQHLKTLLKAGLVSMRRDGQKRMYSISPKGKQILKDISRW
ncbi:MAG: metalloregulator ArsR/SmtB family transcription factor [Candidatus Micrarchaeota archaeon]